MKKKLKIGISTMIAALAFMDQSAHAATNIFSVTASGLSDYTINGALDPTLTLVRGFTYTFNISVSSIHTFYIKTVQGTGPGNQYNTGLSANGVFNGTIIFTVPANAPDTLYYNCVTHLPMTGILNIIDPPAVAITGFSVGGDALIQSTGYDSNTLNLNVQTRSNLVSGAWEDTSIQSNAFSNGTNTTHVLLPDGEAAFFQVRQGFF